MLRGFRKFLSENRPDRYSVDRPKERGMEKGRDREQSTVNQKDAIALSMANLGEILRDRAGFFRALAMPL